MSRLLAVLSILAITAQLTVAYTIVRGSDPGSGVPCGEPAHNAVEEPSVFVFTRTAYHAFLTELGLADGTELPRFDFESLADGALGESTAITLNTAAPGPGIGATLSCADPEGCDLRIKSEGESCPSENGRFPVDVDPNNAVGSPGSYLNESSSKWLDVEENDDFLLEFDLPIKGFAFFASDIGDVRGSLSLVVTRANGENVQLESGSDLLPLFQDGQSSEENPQASGVRTFWGIFTPETDTQLWFKSIRFNKTVPENNGDDDGFGFDTIIGLPETLIIEPPGDCECIIVYNAGNDCSASISGQPCVCIRHESDSIHEPCSVEECVGESGLPDVQNSDGNNIPILSDFSNNFAPTIVRGRH